MKAEQGHRVSVELYQSCPLFFRNLRNEIKQFDGCICGKYHLLIGQVQHFLQHFATFFATFLVELLKQLKMFGKIHNLEIPLPIEDAQGTPSPLSSLRL